MEPTRVTALLPPEQPIDRNAVELIARGLLAPKGQRGTAMGDLVQRLAIDWLKVHPLES